MQSPPLFRNIRWGIVIQICSYLNQIGGPRMVGTPYIVELGCYRSTLRYLNSLLHAVGEKRAFPIWIPLSRFSLVVNYFALGLAFARYPFQISPSIRNVPNRLPAFEFRSKPFVRTRSHCSLNPSLLNFN